MQSPLANVETPIAPLPEEPAALNHPGFGRAAASGAAWMTSVSLLSKVLGMGGQIVLAWLLSPDDFGVMGLVMTVAAFAGVLQLAGLRDILVQRQRSLRRWSNAAFWMSLAIGAATAVIIMTVAPVAAIIFKKPVLIGMLGLVAIRSILDSLSVVPLSQLQIDLRFKAQAVVSLGAAVGTMLMSIVLAWLGFGPYSFVIPFPIIAAIQLAVVWFLSPPRVMRHWQIRRWKHLAVDFGLLLGTAVLGVAVGYGGYLLLGLFHTTEVVGYYFFAFNLSTQTSQIVVANLAGVFFTVLSRFHGDPVRQVSALLRGTKVIAVVAVPLCLLQAAAAEPVIHLIYKSDWYPAIPVFQILSVAMAFALIGTPIVSLIKAQGRFRGMFNWSLVVSIAFLALVSAGAAMGGAVAVAWAVLVHSVVLTPIALWVWITPREKLLSHAAMIFVVPLLSAAVALAPGFMLGLWVPYIAGHDLLHAIVITLSGVVIYPILISRLMPEPWRELVGQSRYLVGRLLQRT